MNDLKLSEDQLVSAIVKSNNNYKYLSDSNTVKKSKLYKAKYFGWLAALILLSPRLNDEDDSFVTVINPTGKRRILEFLNLDCYYSFAKLNDSIEKIKRNRSVLSSYRISKRIKITMGALIFYMRNRKQLKGFLCFVIEYYYIAYFLSNHETKEIVFQGLYDRYNTLFSYLGWFLNIPLIAYQDGACVTDQIPEKIYCNKMYCFDEFEEKQFKKYFSNEDCVFQYTGFKSLLKWETLRPKQNKVIAIASQDWYTGKTIEVIQHVMDNYESEKYTVILFPHYRESIEQYKDVAKKYPKLIIEPGRRYSNIDVLITFYSTIVYDFWSVNNSLKTVCLHIQGYEPAYYSRSNVVVCENYSDMLDECFV